MKSQVQITFRNMKASKEVEGWIRESAEKLETLYGQMIGCRVAIGVPHRHHRSGNPYHVRIDLTVPQGEIVVKREPSLCTRARQTGERKITKKTEVNIPHKNLRIAISDAFRAAGRRLQDYGRIKGRDMKTHVTLPEGRVSGMFPEQGYGFVAANDGREVYFHKNSVLGRGFRRLRVGTTVRFVEEPGERGPQASTIRIVHKKQTKLAPRLRTVSAS